MAWCRDTVNSASVTFRTTPVRSRFHALFAKGSRMSRKRSAYNHERLYVLN